MRNWIVFALLVTLMAVQDLQASPLDDARLAGQVLEMADGYVKASGQQSGEISALVAEVNKRRRSAYGRIAKKNGIAIDMVAAESYRARSKKENRN